MKLDLNNIRLVRTLPNLTNECCRGAVLAFSSVTNLDNFLSLPFGSLQAEPLISWCSIQGFSSAITPEVEVACLEAMAVTSLIAQSNLGLLSICTFAFFYVFPFLYIIVLSAG